jgi:hypothetical protein
MRWLSAMVLLLLCATPKSKYIWKQLSLPQQRQRQTRGQFMQNICYIIPYSYIIDAHENKKKGHVLSLSILYFYIPHPYSLIVSYKLPAGALYVYILDDSDHID